MQRQGAATVTVVVESSQLLVLSAAPPIPFPCQPFKIVTQQEFERRDSIQQVEKDAKADKKQENVSPPPLLPKAAIEQQSMTRMMYVLGFQSGDRAEVKVEYKKILKQHPKTKDLSSEQAKKLLSGLVSLYSLFNKVSYNYFEYQLQRVFLETCGLEAFKRRAALWPLLFVFLKNDSLTEELLIEIMAGLISDTTDKVTREQDEQLLAVLAKIKDVSDIVDDFSSNNRVFQNPQFCNQFEKVGDIFRALTHSGTIPKNRMLEIFKQLKGHFGNTQEGVYLLFEAASVLESCAACDLKMDYLQVMNRVMRIKLSRPLDYPASWIRNMRLDGELNVDSLEKVLSDFESNKPMPLTPLYDKFSWMSDRVGKMIPINVAKQDALIPPGISPVK